MTQDVHTEGHIRAFPSERTRKITLYWSVAFLTALISLVTAYGSDSNVLHRIALESSITLYALVVLAVIADAAVEVAMVAYFGRRGRID